MQLSYSPETSYDEHDDEAEGPIRDERVDGEHDEDDCIVAGEVGEIVVDSVLHFTEIIGF